MSACFLLEIAECAYDRLSCNRQLWRLQRAICDIAGIGYTTFVPFSQLWRFFFRNIRISRNVEEISSSQAPEAHTRNKTD